MAGNPTEPTPSGESSELGRQTGPGEQQEERARAGQRVGPLAIARHVKDDGRALILYTREPGGTT